MYFSNEIAIRIKKRAKEKQVVLSNMFEQIGLGRNTMSNLKTSMPKANTIAKIADYLDCSVDYLLGRTDKPEINNEKKINATAVYDQSEKQGVSTIILPFYRFSASADTGVEIINEKPVEYTNVPKNETTKTADFLFEVQGDSMQPEFFDGDRVLVKHSESIFEGEIGIFALNSDYYVKKMGKNELKPLDPAYDSVKLEEYENVRCIGKIIGTIE